VITLPTGPANGIELVREAVSGLLNDPDIALAECTISRGQPVYMSGLHLALEKNLLGGAVLTQWQYFILRNNDAVATGDISVVDAVPGFESLHQGSFVVGMIDAIRVAETLPEVAKSDYELRILRIPPLYVVAVWLCGKDSLLIPAAPTPSIIESNRVYRETELVTALTPFAESRRNTAAILV